MEVVLVETWVSGEQFNGLIVQYVQEEADCRVFIKGFVHSQTLVGSVPGAMS